MKAIALIHEKLYQSKDYAEIPFSEYAKNLAGNIFHTTGTSSTRVKLRVDIEPMSLAVDRAIPCGLILNELITNALKHGFPEERCGHVSVELHEQSPGRLMLVVGDDGVGIPPGFDLSRASSLGMKLVSTLVEQLDGQLEIGRERGTRFEIAFPAEVH